MVFGISYGTGRIRPIFGKRFKSRSAAKKELRMILKNPRRRPMFPNARVIELKN